MEAYYKDDVISVREWFITVLIAAIPLIGFIMLFVWAFGGNANLNKANLAKAILLFYVFIIALYVVMGLLFGSFYFIGSMFGA